MRVVLVTAIESAFLVPTKHDKFFAAGDGGIEEIAVEHFVVCGMDGDDHAGGFAALVFVDRDGVGQDELVELAKVIARPGGHKTQTVSVCSMRSMVVMRPTSPLKTSFW